MRRLLSLKRLRSESFLEWSSSIDKSTPRLCVVASGYEARGRHWTEKSFDILPGPQLTDWLVFGFTDFRDVLARKDNDKYYIQRKLTFEDAHSREDDKFVEAVTNRINNLVARADGAAVEIHFDYSCMPRLWYCNLPLILENILRPQDKVYFWYSRGVYSRAEYPTAGVSDFRVFAGKPSLGPNARTHILGLGLDPKRSLSIWSVVDPQNLICFYAESLDRRDYETQIEYEHTDLLSRAQFKCSLPVDDFRYSFSKLCSLIREFKALGDVILIPDGPKPLILASSLATLYINELGIVCFHVSRGKITEVTPFDVTPTGSIYGFSYFVDRSGLLHD